MTNYHYIMNPDGSVTTEPDLTTWARWMETREERRIAQDEIGDVRVSTVFLGIDHNFGFGGPPVLFETMIFGGPHDQYQERYVTREEAVEGHARALELAKGVTDAA